MVPTQMRVLGQVRGWSTGWPSVRCGSLGESLSHRSSTVGLDEQRLSMVLELYCRKAGRKGEGKRERERDWTWPRGEKRKRREREERLESEGRERERRGENKKKERRGERTREQEE